MAGNIIEDCEHWRCLHALYTGECMKECRERYKKYYGIEEAEQKLASMQKGE